MAEDTTRGEPTPLCTNCHGRRTLLSHDDLRVNCPNCEPPAVAANPAPTFDLDTEMNAFFNATKDGDEDGGQIAQDAIYDEFARLLAECAALRAELSEIDLTLGNASGFDHCKTRVEKVALMLNTLRVRNVQPLPSSEKREP